MSKDSIGVFALVKTAAPKVVCKQVIPKEKEGSAGGTMAASVAVEALIGH